MFAIHQLRSSGSAPVPRLPSLPSTLLFSKGCSHACTTAASQLFASQSLPHHFHRDGGCTHCATIPLLEYPAKPFRINTCKNASLRTPLTVFRINTYRSGYPKRLKLPLESTLMKNMGGREGVMVNQATEKGAFRGTAILGCAPLPAASYQSPVTAYPLLAGGAQLGVN